MANPFTSALKDFWHSMTSNDRHASHDSPYKTGSHIAVSQNRHAPLTSVTSAIESTTDVSNPYRDEARRSSATASQTVGSPARPYSPGMRSLSSPKVSSVDVVSPGEIQMQNFADGSPPPPPPSHSWKKIDRWAEANYEELYDQLGEGCTQNDINELEHELDMTLPQDVRESLALHDGQERGGRPTGIVLGAMLLDCEEIVQEWKQWKVVNEEYLSGVRRPQQQPVYPLRTLNASASSSSSSSKPHPQGDRAWRQELLEKQESIPPRAIQKAYAHPGWIPLVRDWGGNNIAVDLAPGPLGKWGQIILFGRDYDCKYVIAKSWAHFLATVADDITCSRVVIDEESGAMRLKEFKTDNVEPAYMEILRWRADQRYGKPALGPRRKSQGPPGLNTNLNGANGRRSPYGSPTQEDRGRSPHRFGRQASSSPRHGVGSPLARVQEEISQPQPLRPGAARIRDFATQVEPPTPTKLVDAPTPQEEKAPKDNPLDTPTPAPVPAAAPIEKKEFPRSSLSRVTTGDRQDFSKDDPVQGLGVDRLEDDMKTVAI